MSFEIKNKTAYNENGKLVLVQIGASFFKLKLEKQTIDTKDLNSVLDENDVYLLKKE